MASVPTKRTVMLYANGDVYVARGWDNDPSTMQVDGQMPTRLYHVQAKGDTQAIMQALAQENREHRECDEQTATAQTFYDTVKPYGEVWVRNQPSLKDVVTSNTRQVSVKRVQVP